MIIIKWVQNGRVIIFRKFPSISFDGMAKNITSVAFGGSDLKDLYVTSATHPEGQELKGGHLFVVKNTGAKGLPARNFKE